MTNKQKKEEEIFDFFFENLNPFNALYVDMEDPETYFDENKKRYYYKRCILMYDKDQLPVIIKKLEEITGEQLENEFNYINFQYKFKKNITMAFRNIQFRTFVSSIEVLVSYSLTDLEVRSDTLEEILS